MAYDADKEMIVLFGGRAETGVENDSWGYDGKSWSKLNVLSAPPQRQLATMAYDKSKLQFVIFGGMDGKKNVLGDTWILKDSNWKKVNGSGPVARASHCMTYDDSMQGVILYGGYVNDSGSKEFWQFKDRAWNDMTNKSGPVRIHASITYDQDKRRMLLFGGFDDEGRTNELWQYSNNQWSQITTGNGAIPDPRAEHRSIYIPGKGLFVFGGVIGPDPNTRNRGNDTWLYYDNIWTKFN